MRTHRFHHPGPLADDADFQLPRDAARHATKVLRLRAGDAFTAFDGSGREWPATLTDAAGAFHTGVSLAVDRESPLAVTLVQGISKGDRMDVAIQKAVELGVAAVQPVATARSVVRLDPDRAERRLAHWRAIAAAACEQCGRNVVPTVHEPMDLDRWLAARRGDAVVLDPKADVTPTELASALGHAPTALALVIGPEGGLDEAELAAARDAGCVAMRLGPRVLRTETAGIAAVAALLALYGDYA